jgi:O-antigen ligase
MPISIAASQTLLALAFGCLLLRRGPFRVPLRLALPIAGFALWTLLAAAFSPEPAAGLPQIRKLFVFVVLLLVLNSFSSMTQLWRTIAATLITAGAAALYGLTQFARDYYRLQQQGLPFYEHYVLHQITGFMSHWMTFSGQLMVALSLLLAILLFAGEPKWKVPGWLVALALSVALLAAFTRGIWLGTLFALTYLVTSYRRWMILLIPVAVLVLYLISPSWLQRRNESIFAEQLDSSSRARIVMARVGIRMIAEHPLFGVGPERVDTEFPRYASGEALPDAWYGHLHNSFLHLAAERGMLCLLFLLWLLSEVIRHSWWQLRTPLSPGNRALCHAAIAATLGMVISGLFEYNFGDSEVLMLYLFVISLPHAAVRLQGPASQEAAT